jgi:hypothetical protein
MNWRAGDIMVVDLVEERFEYGNQPGFAPPRFHAMRRHLAVCAEGVNHPVGLVLLAR